MAALISSADRSTVLCSELLPELLIAKATFEIHDKLEVKHEAEAVPGGEGGAAFGWVIVQIGLLDIVFLLDSVITWGWPSTSR